jgi:hypothetical protein
MGGRTWRAFRSAEKSTILQKEILTSEFSRKMEK